MINLTNISCLKKAYLTCFIGCKCVAPLQLLAKDIQFIEPVTQQSRHFSSDNNLNIPIHDL